MKAVVATCAVGKNFLVILIQISMMKPILLFNCTFLRLSKLFSLCFPLDAHVNEEIVECLRCSLAHRCKVTCTYSLCCQGDNRHIFTGQNLGLLDTKVLISRIVLLYSVCLDNWFQAECVTCHFSFHRHFNYFMFI